MAVETCNLRAQGRGGGAGTGESPTAHPPHFRLRGDPFCKVIRQRLTEQGYLQHPPSLVSTCVTTPTHACIHTITNLKNSDTCYIMIYLENMMPNKTSQKSMRQILHDPIYMR